MPVAGGEAPPVGCFVDVFCGGGTFVGCYVFLTIAGRVCARWQGDEGSEFFLEVPGVQGYPWTYSKCGNCGARAPFCVDCDVDRTESATASEFDIPCIEGFADLLSRLPAKARAATIALGFELQDRIAAWWDNVAPATSQDVERWKLAQSCFKGAYAPTMFGPIAAAGVALTQAKRDARFAELWGAFMVFINALPAAVVAAEKGGN